MSDTDDDASTADAEPAEGDGEERSGREKALLPPNDGALHQVEIDDLFDISMDDDQPLTGFDALVGSTRIQHHRLPLLEA